MNRLARRGKGCALPSRPCGSRAAREWPTDGVAKRSVWAVSCILQIAEVSPAVRSLR